jgi:hypothetical protein
MCEDQSCNVGTVKESLTGIALQFVANKCNLLPQ